jgi:hypothetical protein
MNEIIKNLFIQAGGSVEEENGNLWTYSDDLDPELFAQLVVKDCYVALFPALRDMISRGQAYDLIKQHFGVTE